MWKTNKMPSWLKKIKERQEKKQKINWFERLKNRIEFLTDSYTPAEIMDLWEEVERLSFKEFENLKKSLSEKARDFLVNIIL